ncbi:hypothetical protein MRX96_009908 [Rhipicephalus microplus]
MSLWPRLPSSPRTSHLHPLGRIFCCGTAIWSEVSVVVQAYVSWIGQERVEHKVGLACRERHPTASLAASGARISSR